MTAASPRFVLTDVCLEVPPGGLVCICGGIGAGKTSLLHALLSELHFGAGDYPLQVSQRRRVGDRNIGVALVTQQPWIASGTVRQNILLGRGQGFGRRGEAHGVDEDAYANAIKRAQLAIDLASLPAGDATEIGERGINLSGGQKQRVALARVVYSGARMAALDDSLSALDSAMGAAVFESIIRDRHCAGSSTGGAEGMARVVVSSAPPKTLLQAADLIAVVESGRIIAQGTYEDLAASGSLCGIVDVNHGASDDKKASADEESSAQETSSHDKHCASSSGKLIAAEDREVGVVKLSVLTAFVAAAGRGGIIVLLMAYVLGAAAYLGQSVWLAYWSDMTAESTDGGRGRHVRFALVYSSISLLVLALALLRYLLQARLALRASARIHSRMASSVLRAPLSWHDTTPSGRILNRFGRDCRSLDLDVWKAVTNHLDLLCSSGVSLILVISTAPLFVLFLPVVFYMFFYLQSYYRSSSRELKRLLAVSRSPIYHFFSGILPLNALATIRAYCLQSHFSAEIRRLCDKNNTVQYVSKVTDRWLGTRFELMGNFLVLGACCATMQAKNSGSPAFLSLCLTSTMTLARAINYTLRSFTQAESKMTSVERALHFAERLPSESYSWSPDEDFLGGLQPSNKTTSAADPPHSVPDPATSSDEDDCDDESAKFLVSDTSSQRPRAEATKDVHPPHNVSARGVDVHFHGVSMCYRPGLPEVLKKIQLSIAAGSRVGFVGRTGAGKSSLIQALLRLTKLSGETGSGRVLLGGVDVANLAVDEVRQRVAVCPQDCVLFSGTLQSNIDPFGVHSSQEVADVLRRVGFFRGEKDAQTVQDLLRRPVAEGGGDLSGGERQLICVARVLLRCLYGGARLVVLDEATSAMDHKTDLTIQNIMRDQLPGRTVIIIAHRLRSVIFADAVCVIEGGQCVEYDSPHALLAIEDGYFSKLVDQSGEREELCRLAAKAHHDRNHVKT